MSPSELKRSRRQNGKVTTTVPLPREGMMATVHNRRAAIARVKPFSTRESQLHLVDLEYTDTEGPRPTRSSGSARLAPGPTSRVPSPTSTTRSR